MSDQEDGVQYGESEADEAELEHVSRARAVLEGKLKSILREGEQHGVSENLLGHVKHVQKPNS